MSKRALSHTKAPLSGQEPNEEEWEARLARIKAALGYWRERLKSPEKVMPGSSLKADDQIHPEMPCTSWHGGG